jgi:hypothetical protein
VATFTAARMRGDFLPLRRRKSPRIETGRRGGRDGRRDGAAGWDGADCGADGDGTDRRDRQAAASSSARVNTASSIGSVSLPVKVFC